jgi:hypothetical protein
MDSLNEVKRLSCTGIVGFIFELKSVNFTVNYFKQQAV